MRVTTRDPMTGNDVRDRENAPFVLEGKGAGALKICFESEQTKQQYLEIPVRTPEACSLNLYREIADDETVLWD
jgi:hypothetical protein